jgi:hypothetical protein
MNLHFHHQKCVCIDKPSHEACGIELPDYYSYILTMSDINRKIIKVRARIQQYSTNGSHRNIDGGKRFRAIQLAKKSQAHQLKAANEKLKQLLAAKDKLKSMNCWGKRFKVVSSRD